MPMNLVQHRAVQSVWDQTEREWDTERWLAGLAAAALLIAGFRRRSTPGMLLALGGGALAWWASAGEAERCQLRGKMRASWPRRGRADLIGEASEESFPASDAPSWTPTTATGGTTSPH